MNRPPSRIQPGPDGTKPWSYPRLVQPILDGHCVRCHDGKPGDGKSKLALTGGPAGHFTQSYENLKPYVRWHEWGGASISGTVTRPGHLGADESALTRILDDTTHTDAVKRTDEDRRRIFIWLDGNAAFYGTYGENEQLAQKRGERVPPPVLQ
jgi:hypothetical protein